MRARVHVSRSAAVLGGADLRDLHDGPDQRSDVMTMHLLDHLLLFVGRRSAPSGIPVPNRAASGAPSRVAPHDVHAAHRAMTALRAATWRIEVCSRCIVNTATGYQVCAPHV